MNYQDYRNAINGISGVHITPYDSTGEVNHERLRQVVGDIVESGIPNIVTAGNTGEFYALDLDEIEGVYQTAVQATAGRAMVTAGIGRSAREAIRLAASAKAAGVDGLMIHQPPDPFCSPRLVVEYIRQIAATTDLPVIAYARSPGLTAEHFVSLCDIPNVVGVKYAVPDPVRLAQAIKATREFPLQWLCGLAESWALPFHACGARGFTSGLVNVNPQLSLSLLRALEENQLTQARELVDSIAEFEHMRTFEGNGANVTVVKEAMAQMGVEVGPVRAPGVTVLNAQQREKLAQIITTWR